MEDPETQRSGLVFIYDMSESKYSNFDYELSTKILTLLKVRKEFRKPNSNLLLTVIAKYLHIFCLGWLSCQAEEGVDCYCSALVPSSVQDSQAIRSGKIKRSSFHCEHTTGALFVGILYLAHRCIFSCS